MTERPFPWSREVWAIMLDQAFRGRRAAGHLRHDLQSAERRRPVFAAALERYRDRVVLGANFDVASRQISSVVPNTTLIPASAGAGRSRRLRELLAGPAGRQDSRDALCDLRAAARRAVVVPGRRDISLARCARAGEARARDRFRANCKRSRFASAGERVSAVQSLRDIPADDLGERTSEAAPSSKTRS